MANRNEKTIKIRQTGSSIRRDKKQALYLDSLGLGRIGKCKELIDCNSVRRLIAKVRHMVEIEE